MKIVRPLFLFGILASGFTTVESSFAISMEDTNGDGLVLSTGQASIASPTSVLLDGLTYAGIVYDGVEINFDINTLEWSVTGPFPPAGVLDFTDAGVMLPGDNDIRFSGLT